VRDISDQRGDAYALLSAVLDKLAKDPKNHQTHINERKKAEQTLSNLRDESSRAAAALDDVNAGYAKRVRELERREAARFAAAQQLQELEVTYRVRKASTYTKDLYERQKSEFEDLFSAADEEYAIQLADIAESL